MTDYRTVEWTTPLTIQEVLRGMRSLRRKMRVIVRENGLVKFDQTFKRDEMVVSEVKAFITDDVEIRVTIDQCQKVLTITIDYERQDVHEPTPAGAGL